MKWEMWRRVLLFLFFVVNGLCASGNNQGVFKKLCEITGNVSVLMVKDNRVTSHVEEALYGDTGKVSFDKDGVFTGVCSGLAMHSRSEYCSHIQPGGGSTGNEYGCFGHSLLGTFLCLCAKGTNRDEDLCGLNNLGGVGSWISWRGDGHEKILFKTVWDGVKQKCFKNNKVNLETLKNAVEEISGTSQQKSSGYFTLGGSSTTNGHCGGTNPGDACVTYMANGNGIPNIPWREKILKAIETLNQTRNQQQESTNSAQGGHQQEEHDDHSGNEQDNEQEGEEEEEDEEQYVQKSTPQNTSKKPRTRRKIRSTTKKQPTEQHAEALKTILHKDDGSFLPQPFWLLSAVVI